MISGSGDVIRIHQCVSGFTQDETSCHGVLKLCEQLHWLGFNNHVSRVSLRPWNADWSEAAEHIWLLGQHHSAQVIVNIYAYSWGVGWGAVQLARELQKRSIDVHHLVASDGVYRHPWFRFPSLIRRDSRFAPVIRIPANVLHVTPFHQTTNIPQGHRIVGDRGFSGQIYPSVLLTGTHQYMDDADEFHTAAIDAAKSLKDVN